MADFLIVTPDIVGPVKNGGIGTACYHYARALGNAGRSVDILFTGPCDPQEAVNWAGKYRRLGITFLTMNDVQHSPVTTYGTRWYTERSLALMEYLRRRDDRCILFQDWHANGFWTVRAKQVGTGFDRTVIGVIAHSPTEWQNAGMSMFGAQPLDEADLAWAERETIAGADLLVSPSRHMVHWLRDHGFQLPERIELCPYTFEDDLAPPRNAAPDLSHLIFFGRLETRKGLHLLGGALRQLAAESRPRRVSLIGKYATVEGQPTPDYLARLTSELPGIEFCVQTDLDYAAAVACIRLVNGLVVMPSTLDNLPLTIIESITNGFHFIASDVGGIPEMADPAVLFRPTVASLAEMLGRRHEIGFGQLRHTYAPARAREIWLRKTGEMLDHSADLGRLVHGKEGRTATEPMRSPSGLPLRQRGLGAPSIRVPTEGVSICIPFYQHDQYIRRLVNSLLATADENTQFVFVNDGTPESECPVFHALARRLEPLGHVFHTQDNAGPGNARNKAVSLARHERVLFFDSDNVAMPSLVPALLRALAASGADIVSAPFIAVPPMLRQPTPEDALYHYHPSGGSMATALFDNVLGDTCCLTTRKVIEAVGGFQTRRMYTEDWEFYLQLKGRGFRHIVHSDPLFYYTLEENVRRSQTSEYANHTVLWSRFESMNPQILAQLLRTLVHQTYVAVV